MSIQDIFKASQFIFDITKIVQERGIKLEVGSDFEAFQAAIGTQPERNDLAPKFNPKGNIFGENDAFWIKGTDTSGEVVHTQAMRRIDLEGGTLATYLSERFCEFTPAAFQIDEDASRYQPAPGSRSIRGQVCYHGELWLKGGPSGFRGAGMTALLARLAMVMGLVKFAPDYIFGFMFPIAACKGLAAREGYMHTEPNSLLWSVPGETKLVEEWAVWMAQDDIRHLLTIQPQDLFEQLEAAYQTGNKVQAA